MKASYLVANRLPAFSAVRRLSTREGDKEANRPFFREGKSINENNPLVCVIDDDSSIRESLSFLLRSAGLRVQTFCSAQEFLARPPRESVGCLVLDVQLPGISGLDLQQELASGDAQIPIIFITGYGNISMSVRAMKAGAFEFLTKPFRDEDLLSAVDQAINCGRQIGQSNIQLTQKQPYPEDELRSEISASGIVGKSAALRRVLQQVDTVAPNDSTVLILGETGTGKELIVSAIHQRSRRRDNPLVRVNCTSIPRELFESEFFGHAKGAFTGAIKDRAGRFEVAAGGTLFLDEVGEIPLELQSKLLRVLQEKSYERVGEEKTRRADVRIVAATNRDLKRGSRRPLSRGPLLPSKCFPVESCCSKGAQGRHPSAGHTFHRSGSERTRLSETETNTSGLRNAPSLRLARQHPRTAKRHRTCRHFCSRWRFGLRCSGVGFLSRSNFFWATGC